jgi:PAS domain S-box-containing protein
MNPPPQILIIDDERDTRNFMVRLLHRQNYHISTVSSGQDALLFLEDHPETEVVLLDLMMPELDGFAVLETIKCNPATEHIRVVMLTGTNRVKDKVRAFTLGAADYLVKPFERSELIARIETHAKLKRAEAKIEALARFPTEAPHPILRISDSGALMYSNIAGVELLQRYVRDQLDIRVPPPWQAIVQQSLHSNQRVEVEHQSNGRIFTCMFVPLVDQGYVNIYGTDITERTEAQAALQESEERYRMLAENARDLIARLTTDGIYTYVSPASYAILGLTPAELVGRSFYSLLHPDDLAEISQMDPPLLNPHSESIFTLRHAHRHQRHIWMEFSIRSAPSHRKDNIELVMVARDVTERKKYETALQQAHDKLEQRVKERTIALTQSNKLLLKNIEQRKEAEARVIKHNQELLTLQYAGAAIASSLDLQYVLQSVTREMVDILQVEGCAITEWNQVTDTVSLLAHYGPEHWWANGSLAETTAKTVLAKREYRQVDTRKTAVRETAIKTLLILPMVFQDHEIGCVEIADSRKVHQFTQEEMSLIQLLSTQAASAIENARLYQQAQQEITERKRVEDDLQKERATLARRVAERTAELSAANAELARAARLKDEFLASMSHELRTPLNAVLSMSEALQEEIYGTLNDRQQKALKTVEDSGRHLLSLINDILDLSKIEAGKFQLEVDPVSVESLCQASLLFVKQLAHKKQIRVYFTFDNSISVLTADERRMKQILVNLLSNAVKFTPDGGSIGLEVKGDPRQQTVNFTVWDTGIGISTDQVAKLFQPFVQLDSKLSRRYAGTGLGLTLVQRMAELHGGSVSLESQPGQGSRFTVSIPWHIPETSSAVAGSALPPAKDTIRHVLIVEDSPMVAEQYQRYLKELGIASTIHLQGKDTPQKALEIGAELIILDILLPDRSGWEVLADLQANPATRSIPVLVASVVDERPATPPPGVIDCLVKPISRHQLQTSLERAQQFHRKNGNSPAPESLTPTPPRPEKGVILLAEDNEINLITISDYLIKIGYRVIPARTGQEAIDRAGEETPHLILMDIQMPVMDGLEAIARLRADPRFVAVPIIALTALAMPGDKERCLAAGANNYMSKPVSLKGLVKTLEAQLNPI